MSITADLHIHSKYSRAVSQKMNLDEIANWAKIKGIDLVTTGDWTHPLWLREIKTKLKETAPGIFLLNKTHFILTTELSSIYSQGGQTRRIHNLIFSPSIETVEKIIKKLQGKGANLMADGRPILGLSSTQLLELVLSVDENCLLIPCHVWTPWFSLYGSKSGFNSIEECFGKYSKYIYAVETGLSSDPIMNWQIKELKNRSIVSFSDAHSGPKLGREATVFVNNSESRIQNSEFSYKDIIGAIKQNTNGKLKIGYTIEFFPEEGKYHWSGHRSCNIKYNSQQIKDKGTTCPVCNKPLTIGVENRVGDLSEILLDQKSLVFMKNSVGLTFVYDKEKKRRPFVSLVPLLEVLTEINNGSPTKALRQYEDLVPRLGTEFDIILKKPYEEIEKKVGQKLKEAVKIIRERKVFVDPGFDGVFGTVKVFNNHGEEKNKQETDQKTQPTLF